MWKGVLLLNYYLNSKMNQFNLQQSASSFCDDRRGLIPISDPKGSVVCPKPRRVGILANSHISMPLRLNISHQVEICDSKAGAELLDIILMKGHGDEKSAAQVAASPPFFRGSPPMRVANPLIRDDRFGCEKPTYASPLQDPSASGLASPSSARTGGCARIKFGLKPAAVRVEGFDCLNRDRQNSSIPAMA